MDEDLMKRPSMNMHGLEDGWYEGGSKKPTPEILELARKIEDTIFMVPLQDGGMQLEMHLYGIDLEIEFTPDGKPDNFWIGRD